MKQTPATSQDVRLLVSILLDLAKAGERLANSAIGHDPGKGSTAERLAADPLNSQLTWRGETPVDGAHQDVFYAELAGFDHMRAYVSALRAERLAGVSVATITRGGIEAFARAHWLLDTTTTAQLTERHAAMTLSDLKFILKLAPDTTLHRWAGEPIDALDYQTSVLDSLAGLGLKRIVQPPVTEVTSNLLTAALQGNGRLQYSQISAVAHTETYAINAFLNVQLPDDSLPPASSVTLTLPRNFAIEYAMYLSTTCCFIQGLLVDRFLPPVAEIDRWEGSRTRSLQRLSALMASRVRSV